MANTANDFSNSIRAQLKLIDPDISADPGTPERKIIDSVAEAMADISSDQYILQYQFDIDTKVGSDLDKFVSLFGFARQAGKRSTGTVTFSVTTPSITDIYIPVGTQVSTQTSSISGPVTFVTTTTVVLYANTTSVDAPVQSVNVGLSGNVPANTITVLNSTTTQISSVNNSVATTGGTEIETDTALRLRFKNTIFRNIAGTRDQFLALALSSQYCTQARVITPIDRFVEYLQIPASLTVTSQIPFSKFTYNFNYYVTQNSSSSTEIFFQPNIDFTFTTTVPPSFTVLNADPTRNFNVGDIVLLEHSYCSINSRNNPTNNIANYVDVFIAGTDSQSATDSTYFPITSGTGNQKFVTSSGSNYFVNNFRRSTTRSAPTIGNVFQSLLWQPVTALPSSITIQGNTYYNNTDYWLVEDTTVYKGSKRALNGIEWGSRAITTVSSGTTYQINYTFNKLIVTLNELMDEYKQIATDVLVHSANNRYYNVNLVIAYSPGFSRASVDAGISQALTNFFGSMNFGSVIQMSDIVEITHEVSGVDNVRIATSSDATSFGIQEIAPDGTTTIGSPHTTDFALLDSDLPILNSIITNVRSANTWSS